MNKAPRQISDGRVDGRRLLVDEGEGVRKLLQSM